MLQHLVTLFSFLLTMLFALTTSPSLAHAIECKIELHPSYWDLPANGQRLVVGLLIETADSLRPLAVGDYYWSTHEVLYARLQKDFPIKRILWAGEMLLENKEDHPAPGHVAMTLNTSGYVWTKLHQPGSVDINDPFPLKETLETYRPDLITPWTQYLTFDDEHAHLDALFQNLHERTRQTPDDTVRHRFRNILTVVAALSATLQRDQNTKIQDQMERIGELSAQTKTDILQFLESQKRYSYQPLSPETPASGSETGSSEEREFQVMVNVIKYTGLRVNIVREEKSEVIVLNGARDSL